MSKAQKLLTGIGVLAVLILIGIAVGYLGTKAPLDNVAATNETRAAQQTPENRNAQPNPPRVPDKTVRSGPDTRANHRTSVSPTTISTPIPANVLTNWEDKIDEILTTENVEDAEKAKQMLAIFMRLPEEGKVEVAQHLSNLVPDEDYGPLAKLLTDTSLSEDVLDVFMADVLNRPNSLKLPALLEVARDSKNPKSGEAKDLLELFLEEDYGADWNKWQQKMEEWVKANPD